MKVTVFGATGVVGSALLPLLVADHELVAVSRSTRATGQGVRWVEGDANSAGEVARAIEGTEVVYYLVHSLGGQPWAKTCSTDISASRSIRSRWPLVLDFPEPAPAA